jgi:hypothetical protein
MAQELSERLGGLLPDLKHDALAGEIRSSSHRSMSGPGICVGQSDWITISPIAGSDKFCVTSGSAYGDTDSGITERSEVIFEAATADEVVSYFQNHDLSWTR